MARLRWLLTMEYIPDPERGKSRYQVWLQELDETSSELRGPFATIDDLYTALLARWDNRNQDTGGFTR